MSEELYFTPISKGNISILKFYCKCKTETHPLAPITVGLPASNNETVIANIPRERPARQLAFQELPQLILTHNSKNRDSPPSWKSCSNWGPDRWGDFSRVSNQEGRRARHQIWFKNHRVAVASHSSHCRPAMRKRQNERTNSKRILAGSWLLMDPLCDVYCVCLQYVLLKCFPLFSTFQCVEMDIGFAFGPSP